MAVIPNSEVETAQTQNLRLRPRTTSHRTLPLCPRRTRRVTLRSATGRQGQKLPFSLHGSRCARIIGGVVPGRRPKVCQTFGPSMSGLRIIELQHFVWIIRCRVLIYVSRTVSFSSCWVRSFDVGNSELETAQTQNLRCVCTSVSGK